MPNFNGAVTMVLGMSDGGSILRFAPDGVRQLVKAEIKWDKIGPNTYWNKSWLLEFSKLARTYKNDDDCLICGMPGADLAIMSDGREWWNTKIPSTCKGLLNYTSVPEDARSALNEKILPIVSSLYWVFEQ